MAIPGITSETTSSNCSLESHSELVKFMYLFLTQSLWQDEWNYVDQVGPVGAYP